MIKLLAVSPAGEAELNLSFSDGATGRWSAQDLLKRGTVLTKPLEDPAYFGRAFIEGGALAWPNGLELSAASLHRRLGEAGQLTRRAA